MSQPLSDAEKLTLYKAGAYAFPPPPVCTAQWDDAAWIAFIDLNGRWGKTYKQRLERVSELLELAYKELKHIPDVQIPAGKETRSAEALRKLIAKPADRVGKIITGLSA